MKKLLSAQGFGLKIYSIVFTKKKQDVSFLHVTLLPDLIYLPPIYYQIISNSKGVKACTRFLVQRRSYKKVRVVSLARDTPTGNYAYTKYQNISNH